MTKQFFDKFPIIRYANNSVRDIFAKITFSEKSKQNPDNFMQVRLQDDVSLRADVIADEYYGSPYLDWLHYMANDIIDPHNDSFLDSQSFVKMIVSKYGSVEVSQQKIIHYINNWFEKPDDKLSVAAYESSPQYIKKYYTARIDYGNNIIEYVRHRKDWKKITNKIRILTVNSVASLTVGLLVYQYVGSSLVASGEITDINTTDKKVTVKNITGAFVATGGNVLYRQNSTSTQYTVTEIASPLDEDNISEAESVFWSPMTYYEYENEINELRRNVNVLRTGAIAELSRNMEKLLE